MFTNRFYATIIDLLIHLRITIFYTSRRVGIGRRDRLKICCPQGRVGSSPTAGIETGILSGGFPFFAVCFRPRPLDLDLSTSGVVCGHLSTNHPRGRSILTFPRSALLPSQTLSPDRPGTAFPALPSYALHRSPPYCICCNLPPARYRSRRKPLPIRAAP